MKRKREDLLETKRLGTRPSKKTRIACERYMLTSLDCIHQLTKLVRGDRFGSLKRHAEQFSYLFYMRMNIAASSFFELHLKTNVTSSPSSTGSVESLVADMCYGASAKARALQNKHSVDSRRRH